MQHRVEKSQQNYLKLIYNACIITLVLTLLLSKIGILGSFSTPIAYSCRALLIDQHQKDPYESVGCSQLNFFSHMGIDLDTADEFYLLI